jgi:hypothetical protein
MSIRQHCHFVCGESLVYISNRTVAILSEIFVVFLSPPDFCESDAGEAVTASSSYFPVHCSQTIPSFNATAQGIKARAGQTAKGEPTLQLTGGKTSLE